MDILFQRCWLGALLKPVESGMSTTYQSGGSFYRTLMKILKPLRGMLYGKPLEDPTAFGLAINQFIERKKYFSGHCS